MRFLLTLFLLLPLTVGATTYTEFYVQTTGSNLNSGHTTDDAATYTGTGGNWTNNTSATTGTWFKTGESLAAVTNGAWAALYTDGTTTNAQFVALVTAVDDAADTITLSLQNYCGANPSTVVAGMSIKVGGAWKGFTTNTMANGGGFPFNFLSATATNAQYVLPRCNIKSGTTYNIASAITHAYVGPIRFQGYTTSLGDGGKATIDGGATGTSYVLLTISGADNDLYDMIFANNGNSGSARGVSIAAGSCDISRVVVHDMHRACLSVSAASTLTECEFYAGNKSNTAGEGGAVASGGVFIRCISHDNTGSNSEGFRTTGAAQLLKCIASKNGKNGFSSSVTMFLIQCDSYNNTASGVDLQATAANFAFIENCNFIKNGTYGVNSSGSALRNGQITGCGFGTGTMTNASGNFAALGGILVSGTVLYGANQTPWTDPDNGDFRISLTAAKSAGRGAFTQLAVNSPTNTVSFPDIGAAQSVSTNSASGGGSGSYTFSQ